ncbi:MAG TPA: hypothetical protein VMS17_08095, partial [Gemmataceae bacterium]|nr:hypothetical protein [Gemmataceae bacterium]
DDLRLQLNDVLSKDKDLQLQHVDVDIAGTQDKDMEAFQLGNANFAFYVFQRGRVTASRVLGKDNEGKLTDADVKAIMELHVKPFGRQNTLLLVTRSADLSESLTALLRQIDAAAEKNPAAALHPVLALLSDDPMRNDAAAKLEMKTKELMLKHIDVVGAGASDLVKYHVENSPFAFFLIQRGKTLAGRALGKDEKLTSDAAKEIMKMLAEKAGADKQ